jgi:hypothetical protein
MRSVSLREVEEVYPIAGFFDPAITRANRNSSVIKALTRFLQPLKLLEVV